MLSLTSRTPAHLHFQRASSNKSSAIWLRGTQTNHCTTRRPSANTCPASRCAGARATVASPSRRQTSAPGSRSVRCTASGTTASSLCVRSCAVPFFVADPIACAGVQGVPGLRRVHAHPQRHRCHDAHRAALSAAGPARRGAHGRCSQAVGDGAARRSQGAGPRSACNSQEASEAVAAAA